MAPLPLTVGTAGHIDHGKTVLVRALGGRDINRAPEKRRGGMPTDLGFADLDLGGRHLSLVDVPGHERSVGAMIAGASGFDMFLLVVATDDGPMPQTHEHLAVLRALGIEHGVLALTKVDLVDAERRRLAREEAAALAPNLPLVEVSSRTGEGIEELRGALAAVAAEAEAERRVPGGGEASDLPVLHVDRVFSVDDQGTVVTGTLWSGRIERGQRVLLLPEENEARVRSIQVHDQPLDAADSHQRVALELGGVDRDEIQRGDVVTVMGAGVRVTYRLDVRLTAGAAAILAEQRVQVHLATRDSPAQITDLAGGRAQLRLEQPLLARAGDRVVVRQITPPRTLGGGVVLDPSPPRPGADREAPGEPEEPKEPAPPPVPASAGPGPFARRVLAALEADGAQPRDATQLAGDLDADRQAVEAAFSELAIFGEAVCAKPDVAFAAPVYRELARLILALAERDGSTGIAEVREALGVSRKYAQALLEQLDSERRLHREGDRHLPRRKAPG